MRLRGLRGDRHVRAVARGAQRDLAPMPREAPVMKRVLPASVASWVSGRFLEAGMIPRAT
jgi:hypothetical protein